MNINNYLARFDIINKMSNTFYKNIIMKPPSHSVQNTRGQQIDKIKNKIQPMQNARGLGKDSKKIKNKKTRPHAKRKGVGGK